MIQTAIATNIITGFLGSGKTSLIKALLKAKPKDESWAVLVNEFGDVGIDSALLSSDQQGIHIREVAGGCMCCAAGVPMQVAITQLIAKAKPDRLLIEPTGLGHPETVLKVLMAPHFKHIIAMHACVTLVDARNVKEVRYRTHDTFLQQLSVADIILASKSDKYKGDEFNSLIDFLREKELNPNQCLRYSSKEVGFSQVDIFQLQVLLNKVCTRVLASSALNPLTQLAQSVDVASKMPRLLNMNSPHDYLLPFDKIFDEGADEQQIEFDERGIWGKQHQAEGHYSYGWVFDPKYEFGLLGILALVNSLDVVRIKAVLITDEGIVAINRVDGEMDLSELDEVMDSRIEIIAQNALIFEEIEYKLITLLK
ncbi:CobW family GTP-binding protein [Shewanella surugensis]|uniref:GTP-binding protein n=1 Tax=Shewanella surugensis TaxID=212020 RepID=A0ABT0LG69_9GAMM|nr:GTP-binding protein [Shewanella surugensis]MCL1126679.1 GTP-binding protein [Shewanella surugensis]